MAKDPAVQNQKVFVSLKGVLELQDFVRRIERDYRAKYEAVDAVRLADQPVSATAVAYLNLATARKTALHEAIKMLNLPIDLAL